MQAKKGDQQDNRLKHYGTIPINSYQISENFKNTSLRDHIEQKHTTEFYFPV